MSKHKMAALLVLAGGFMMVLGMNCIPNIGGTILPAPVISF